MFLLVFGRKYIYLAGFVILKNMNWEEHIRESIFFIILLLGNTLSGYADIPLEQLVDSLNVVLDNKQVYVGKKEQKIQAIKQLLQESNISILQEYDLNDRLYLAYIIHSGFISGYQNRYGDNLKPPTNVYHRMTA